jgi:hypothetical protein
MNELEQLRALDPAADARENEQAAERLLRTVLAEPRPVSRRRARRRLLVAIPVAAAVLIALPLALDRSGESLAAKAYAATTPGDEIIHEISVHTVRGGASEMQESWSRPIDGRARSVSTAAGREPAVTVIGRNGVAHLHLPWAHPPDQTIKPVGGPFDPMIRRLIDGARSVTLGFRDDYAGQKLHDAGTTTFDGRTVHVYTADTERTVVGHHAAHVHRTFYLDPDTDLPIGERVDGIRPDGSRSLLDTTVVKTYEKLPPTPENLAKLLG